MREQTGRAELTCTLTQLRALKHGHAVLTGVEREVAFGIWEPLLIEAYKTWRWADLRRQWARHYRLRGEDTDWTEPGQHARTRGYPDALAVRDRVRALANGGRGYRWASQ